MVLTGGTPVRCFVIIRSIFEEVALLHVSPYNATSGPKGALVGRASEFFGVLMCQKLFLRGTPATFSARSSSYISLLFLSSRTTLGATLGRARMTYNVPNSIPTLD